MKRLTKLLCVMFSSLSMSACSISFDGNTENKSSGVYGLFDIDEEGEIKDIETYKKMDLNYLVRKGEELNPYLTLEDYSSLLSQYAKTRYKFEVDDYGGSATFTISNPANEYVFYSVFNAATEEFQMSGDISAALTISKDYSKSSIYPQMRSTDSVVKEAEDAYSFTYSSTDYSIIIKRNKTYFPLSLLEGCFSDSASVYHVFNYERIVQVTDYDHISKSKYLVNGKEYTAYEEMSKAFNAFTSIPNYLKKDRLNSLYFLLENKYGLKYTWGVSSMRKYLEKNINMNNFNSDDPETRASCLAEILRLLNDGHTSIRDFSAPWLGGYEQDRYGETVKNMVKARSELTTLRESFYKGLDKEVGDIIYFNNDKAAFLSMDGFELIENAFNEDGSLKDDLYKVDTYFYLAKALYEIKDKGTVTDVILDISLNGGGVIGIMMKMLALLSSNNRATVYFKMDHYEMIQRDYTEVDSDGDGVYSFDDVFGKTFKFYILTSEYSFSCGNAFPYYAKKNNYAKIIGQKSSGGECSVIESYLPSGERLFHSSTMHIGWYDQLTKTWEGDEGGVPVDTAIDHSDFYNLDKLTEIISA